MSKSRFYEVALIICSIKYILCFSGICKNATELNEVFCCANYENNNRVCTECTTGTTSVEGGRCQPCRDGRYGHKCSGVCNCDQFIEICDHVNGTCFLKEADEKLSTSYLTSESSHGKTYSQGQDSDGIITATTSLDGVIYVTVESSDGVLNPNALIIYCLSGACLMLIIAFCFVINKNRLKSKRKPLNHPLSVLPSPNVLNDKSDHSEVLEVEEDVYHLIDESKMIDFKTNLQQHAYLEIVSTSDESDAQELQNEDPNEYLHPYNTLVDDNKSDAHEYEEGISFNGVDTSSTASSESLPGTDKEGYLHMYQQLQAPLKAGHMKKIVHGLIQKENDISSDSSETSVNNEEYSNTYQPLHTRRCSLLGTRSYEKLNTKTYDVIKDKMSSKQLLKLGAQVKSLNTCQRNARRLTL